MLRDVNEFAPPPPLSLSLSLSLSLCLFVFQTLPALVELVQCQDLAVRVDACWALSFLAEGKDKQIQVKSTAAINILLKSYGLSHRM